MNAAGPSFEAVAQAIEFWGMAVANLVSLFNPEKIVFGGGVFGPGAKLLSRIRAEARKWAQPISIKQVSLETSKLAGDAGDHDVASFHWRSALDASPGPDEKTWSARRLSGALVRDGDPEAAAEALALSSRDEAEALEAIRRYREGRDRRPLVGGLLGLIPGLGYTYSGEYANAGRSLILNALFIWAMAYSAQEDQWGAFAVAGFFEVTWYSGSIYGGVDAAHRFNERRREDCARAIERGATAEPDYPTLPLMKLRVKF